MSEKKDPNEINFDDEFLNTNFDDASNPTPSTDEQTPKSEPHSKLDELDANSVTLSDLHLSTNTNDGVDLSNVANLTDDSTKPETLQQNSTPNPEPDTTGVSNAPITAGSAVGTGIKATEKPTKKGTSGLFGKKDSPKPSKRPKPAKPAKAGGTDDLTKLLGNSKKLNTIILGGVIILALIGVMLYMVIGGNDESIDHHHALTPAVSTPTPTTTPEPEQVETQNQNIEHIDATDSVLPTIKPVVDPDEILNATIPTDPTLIKEEIDRLTDKDAQIAEQEKLIQDQLTLMEDLTTAKAEQIALLEAQIAELEKQKNSTETATDASEQ